MITLGREAAKIDVAAFSQAGSASVNRLDTGIRRIFHTSRIHKGAGKQGKSNPQVNNVNNSLPELWESRSPMCLV